MLKIVLLAAMVSVWGGVAAAQPQTPAPITAAPPAGLSVETTAIGDIIKNPQAKAVLEKAFPEIPQFYDQISSMTLTQVAPMSQGAIDDTNLKSLQAEFDKIK